MSIDFKMSIVYILKEDSIYQVGSRTVGTGFVITSDGLIITCAHVVNLAQASEFVHLVFCNPTIRKERREIRVTRVVPEYLRDAGAEDIAILRLEGLLPPAAVPLPLRQTFNKEQTFFSYGFPEAKPEDGLPGECRVIGPAYADTMPLIGLNSNQVTKGFSGAPVWDEKHQAVIGMITSIIGTRKVKIAGTVIELPFDRAFQQIGTVFATPVETLREVCPLLQISEVCPYRGLDAFTEEQAQFFSGREYDIERLLDRLRYDIRFLAVLGPSGSGKSSVVQAGLIPQLRQGVIRESEHWGVIVTRPADDPFKQLAAQGVVAESRNLKEGAKAWLAQHSQHKRFVLVIDQFEELLIACPKTAYQEFVEQLVQLLGSPLPITVIITMRDDFYGQIVRQELLVEWMERGLVNISQTLKQAEVTAIVQEPAKAVGLRFEEGLVEIIVKDALETTPSSAIEGRIARSTILPLLEVALTELWRRREDGMLRRKAYNTMGGVTGGLTQWADEVFYGLDGKKQQEAQHIFTELVYLGNEEQGSPDSRRRMSLASLSRNQREIENVHQIVQKLADGKLLVTAYDMQSNQQVVEIIHDALLWEWGEMRQWLQKDRKFLVWHQELERLVHAWVETDVAHPARREKEKLLRGSDLREAIKWQKLRSDDLSEIEYDFIEVSRKRWEWERRLIFAAGGLALAAASGGAIRLLQYTTLPYTEISIYHSHFGTVLCVAWSPKAALIASGGTDRTVQVYTSNSSFIYRYTGHARTVTGVAWSPDGFRIASASADNTVQVWYADGQDTTKYIYKEHTEPVLAVTWSPARSVAPIASAGEDHTIHVWDANGGHVDKYTSDSGPINELSWSPNGLFIAAACGVTPNKPRSDDNTVQIWDTTIGKRKLVYRGHSSQVISVAWSPDGKYIASAGFDGTVQVWFTANGQLKYPYRGHNNVAVTSVAWSLDGRLIASASYDKTVQVWDAFDGTLLCTYGEHKQIVFSVAWSRQPGVQRIASAGDDKVVRVWQLK